MKGEKQMKQHFRFIQVLAVIIAVLVCCFIYTGKQVWAIVDSDIADIFESQDEDSNNQKKTNFIEGENVRKNKKVKRLKK